MTILNIVDNITRVNFGIWNAAIATAPFLEENHQIKTLLWFPASNDVSALPPEVHTRSLPDVSISELKRAVLEEGLSPATTLVVTHGCWQFPTVWGAQLSQMGFKWVYVPHGMLEPWSMRQKRWKKTLYYHLREHPLSRHADVVRAVGKPEYTNLCKAYRHVWLNPNGIHLSQTSAPDQWKEPETINYLFMARLHAKKGIVPLVKAWLSSPQHNDPRCHFYIAGPDDGELATLRQLITPQGNITLLGGVYGHDKESLLNRCHIYLLPSHSEGFPTSVLEAMAHRQVAVITDGCNFPEAFDNWMAIRTSPHVSDLHSTLQWLHNQQVSFLENLTVRSSQWIQKNYNNQEIARQQALMYHQLMNG
ncbi:MAG: glycosyltransferase [Marinilabiliaceae bacterium]|nr:glycosyltransferase [Marinilabiliaceae bacterium]